MSSAKISRTFGFSVAIIYPVSADPLLAIRYRVVTRLVGGAVADEVVSWLVTLDRRWLRGIIQKG